MIETLVARVLATRNASHLAHWATASYAQHVALNEFYDAVLDAIDELVECYQGTHGKIGKVDIETVAYANMVGVLADDLSFINENRNAIADGEPALINLIDTLSNVYEKALYKLRFLS